MTVASTPGQTIVLWGARGGVGTTVAATQLAFQHPRHVILIDLGGDLVVTFGLRRSKHGVRDLEQADSRTTDEILSAAAVQVAPRVALVPHGGRETPRQLGDGPLADLAEWIRHHEGVVIVDAGTGPPPTALAEVADESLAVTRLSSVDAQRLRALKVPPTALIVVEHPDAWLTKDDIVNAASAGIYATMPHDSDIAHAIDTGTFLQRQPQLRELSAMPDIGEPIWFNWPEESYGTTVERYWSEEFDGFEDGFESARGDCIHVGPDIWAEKYDDRQWAQSLGHPLRLDARTLNRDQRVEHLMQHPRRPDRGNEPLGTWITELPSRRAIDVDFGHAWQSRGSVDRWRVSWNTGSGELHTVNHRTSTVTVLGVFKNEADVENAINGWSKHHDDPDGLAWLDAVSEIAVTDRQPCAAPAVARSQQAPPPSLDIGPLL